MYTMYVDMYRIIGYVGYKGQRGRGACRSWREGLIALAARSPPANHGPDPSPAVLPMAAADVL